MNIEGKLSNLYPRDYAYKSGIVKCAKCRTQFKAPLQTQIKGLEYDGQTTPPYKNVSPLFTIFSYLTVTEDARDHYIYPTNSGRSVCYCSKYCRDKHNHRFHSVVKEADIVKYSHFLLSMISDE